MSDVDEGGRAPTSAKALQQLVAAPSASAVASGLLGVAAAIQAATMTIKLTASGSSAAGQTGNLQLALVLLSLFAVLPLALLRSYPSPAALIITAANTLSAALLHSLTVAGVLAQLGVFYALGVGGMQLLAAALSVPFALLALFNSAADSGRLTSTLTAGLIIMLAAAGPLTGWAGAALRARRTAAEHHESRRGVESALLENTARGERARISRELHDVVAHHISMIAVQAEAARLTTPDMPPAGAQRLSAIGDTARTALTEMRRLLGVLREDTGTDQADRQPPPSLAELTGLIDDAREVSQAGARFIVSGWPAPLDPGVELAAYRIVQEALTNARRHAPGAAVDVELRFQDDVLWLRVRDNGPGPLSDGVSVGNGLRGMAERATAVGGSLRAGSAVSGGFLVEATLPAKSAKKPETSP
jgi:signal transduction histidine kinase